jgi:hypothetical protein
MQPLDQVHCCDTVDANSPRRPSSAANSVAAWLCLLSCWFQGVLWQAFVNFCQYFNLLRGMSEPLSSFRRQNPRPFPACRLSLAWFSTGPKRSYRPSPVTMSLLSGRCPASTSRISYPTSLPSSCSLLRVWRFHPSAAYHTPVAQPSCHGTTHLCMDSASPLVCLCVRCCSHVKFYSWRRWTHRLSVPHHSCSSAARSGRSDFV